MSGFTAEDRFLVTGASSGIGRTIALNLNAAGATVLANGRDEDRLAETSRLAPAPERLRPVHRDLAADMDGLKAWLQSVRGEYGPLRGLVCSAGITWNAPMTFYARERVGQLFDICCHAPLMLSGAFCDRRVNAGEGSAIVHIAAAAAVEPNPGQGAYAAAKAALVAGARCLAREAASRKIRVNCISPGLVEGPMMESTCRQLGPDFLARELPLYPLGIGRPEYVADLAAFLLSDAARWMTGQNILLSGGRV